MPHTTCLMSQMVFSKYTSKRCSLDGSADVPGSILKDAQSETSLLSSDRKTTRSHPSKILYCPHLHATARPKRLGCCGMPGCRDCRASRMLQGPGTLPEDASCKRSHLEKADEEATAAESGAYGISDQSPVSSSRSACCGNCCQTGASAKLQAADDDGLDPLRFERYCGDCRPDTILPGALCVLPRPSQLPSSSCISTKVFLTRMRAPMLMAGTSGNSRPGGGRGGGSTCIWSCRAISISLSRAASVSSDWAS
mmetsp:Transcript_22163/g.49175  ORF Transcript_22163/g.49175 Transcript_22163/m.49175 type:complete len:253 (+) Transcript_22163:2387-3145(+)